MSEPITAGAMTDNVGALVTSYRVEEADPVVRQSDLTALRWYVEALDSRLTDLEHKVKNLYDYAGY